MAGKKREFWRILENSGEFMGCKIGNKNELSFINPLFLLDKFIGALHRTLDLIL